MMLLEVVIQLMNNLNPNFQFHSNEIELNSVVVPN